MIWKFATFELCSTAFPCCCCMILLIPSLYFSAALSSFRRAFLFLCKIDHCNFKEPALGDCLCWCHTFSWLLSPTVFFCLMLWDNTIWRMGRWVSFWFLFSEICGVLIRVEYSIACVNLINSVIDGCLCYNGHLMIPYMNNLSSYIIYSKHIVLLYFAIIYNISLSFSLAFTN